MRADKSSKTSLFLMELIIAILFFSLAGAVCIQLFVRSHIISRESVELNQAVLWSQNTAEAFKGCGGNTKDMAALFENCLYDAEDGECNVFYLFFDKAFQPVSTGSYTFSQLREIDCAYVLSAFISNEAKLRVCSITVSDTPLLTDLLPQNVSAIYKLTAKLYPEKEAAHDI